MNRSSIGGIVGVIVIIMLVVGLVFFHGLTMSTLHAIAHFFIVIGEAIANFFVSLVS